MKIFEIYDAELDCSCGVLLYYEKEKIFIIELSDALDEWTAPVLFSSFVKRNIFTIPRDVSLIWVRERIIPSGRQNIDAILNTHHLKDYDEIHFLEISRGICSQDSLMLKSRDMLPEYVNERMSRNLIDVMALDKSLLCFFNDKSVRIVEMNALGGYEGVDKLMKNRSLFESASIGAGGYYVTFNDVIDIPAAGIFSAGIVLPLMVDDFLRFVKNNIIDTGEACNLLSCSRQNLSYLVEKGSLTPIREARGNLYLKGEVLQNRY